MLWMFDSIKYENRNNNYLLENAEWFHLGLRVYKNDNLFRIKCTWGKAGHRISPIHLKALIIYMDILVNALRFLDVNYYTELWQL